MYKILRKSFNILMVAMMVTLSIGCSDDDAPSIVLESIQITPAQANVPINTTGEYTATAHYSDSTSADVTQTVVWSSDNNETVSIVSSGENAGYASALQSGSANIIATMSGITSNTATVTVTSATLDSIQISPASKNIAAGLEVQYIAVGIYSDGANYPLTKFVTWQSSEESVAKIASNGLATTLAVGSTDITASVASINTVTSNTASLDVTSATMTSVLISTAQAHTTENDIAIGTTGNFIATAYFTDNSIVDVTNQVSWLSSENSVVTVTATGNYAGYAEALSAGKSTISASMVSIHPIDSNTISVEVAPTELTEITISQASSSLSNVSPTLIVGTTIETKATGTFSDGSSRDITNEVTWKATTQTVSVDQSGFVQALSIGSAEITAHYLTQTAALIVDSAIAEVVEATIDSIDISGPNEAPIGTSVQLTAIASYNNSSALDVTTQATWMSDQTGVSIINGLVTSTSTADVEITAIYDGVSTTHSIHFREAVLEYLEIQESYSADGNGKIITDTTQKIYLVDDVNYDPVSPNAYYPTVWAVYTDGHKEYVTTEAFWWSSNQNSAYVNTIQGSFVFGKDLAKEVEISAKWGGEEASFYVDVIIQEGAPTLDTIVFRTDDGTDVTNTKIDIPEGEMLWVTAYGQFSNGTEENINAKSYYSSSAPKTAFVIDQIDSNIRALNPGTAQISATWQGVTGIVNVEVIETINPELQSIEIQKGYVADGSGEVISDTNPLFMEDRDKFYVTAWGNYSDGQKRYINTDVFWKSSNEDTAKFPPLQKSSELRAVNLGSTTITATLAGVEGLAAVYVVEVNSLIIAGIDELAIGIATQLNAIATLNNGTDTTSAVVNDKVTWLSSDIATATVDSTGLVTSISEGHVTITSTAKEDDTIVATKELAIVGATLESIQIEYGHNETTPNPIISLDVEITTEEYITAWGLYSDGSRRYINTDVVWWSSDQQTASIFSGGFNGSSNVYGRELGKATITASLDGKSASLAVTVVNTGPILLSIDLEVENQIVDDGIVDIEVGSEKWVTAYGNYDDGSRKDINAKVFYTSSDLGVAFILDEVSSNVYGISVGTAIISVEWQEKSASFTANIITSTAPILTSIEIQKSYDSTGNGEVISDTNPLYMAVGDVQYITAWGIYSGGTKEYINTQVFWASQDQSIASMSITQQNSDVTAEKLGSTTVSATLDGITASVPVHVIEVEGYKISGVNDMALGTMTQLSAIGTLTNGTDTTSAIVSDKANWSSSDTDIATVDSTGLVTSVKPGTVTITATGKIDTNIIVTHALTILDAELLSIQIEQGYVEAGGPIITTLDIVVTEYEYITAWGLYADGSRRYINTNAVWWSSDQQVVSINSIVGPNSSSEVYGKELGSADVTANYSGLAATVKVTVIPQSATLQSIEIRKNFESTDSAGGTVDIPVGQEKFLEAWGHYSDNTIVNINSKVFWSSSDMGTASIVDELSSYVHGISADQATITAEWQGISASITANVQAYVEPELVSIELHIGSSENGEIIDDGANPLNMSTQSEQYVTAWGIYNNGSKEYINTDVWWESDDDSIAKLPLDQSSSTVQTRLKDGKTQIHASMGKIVGTVTVNVSK